MNDQETVAESDEIAAEESFQEFAIHRKVVTPIIIQMEAAECSAVALAIILAYYHKYVSIEELRMACNVTRDGSNAWNIVQAANHYGLNARGFSLEIEDLPTVKLPAIIFWEFEHFVVLEGYGNKCFYINDPATGARTISEEDFDRSFTGVILEFNLTDQFVRSGAPPKLMTLLGKHLKSVKPALFFIFLTQIGLIIPSLALSVLSQIFIDQAFVARDITWAKGILIAIILAMVVAGLFVFLQERALIYLRGKLSLQMLSKILWHLLRLPISFFAHRYAGEIAYRMTLVDAVVEVITGTFASTFLNFILIFIYGFAIAYYSPILAIIAAMGGILNLLLLQYVARARENSLACYQTATSKSMAFSFGILENIDTIKSMAMEYLYFASWAGYFTKALNALQDIQRKDILLGVLPPFFNALVFMALLAIGGSQVLYGQISVGTFVALQILLGYFISPFINLVGSSQMIQHLKVDLARLDDIIEHSIDINFKIQASMEKERLAFSSKKLEGYVEVKNITFGYSHLDPPLLEEINLKMQPGKTMAIVGSTGCGKSTLALLLAGLLHPWKGELLYDGQPRSALPRYQVTSSVALIEQRPFLFIGSIKDNLTFYNPLIDQEEMMIAAQDACIHEEIMARRGGYDLQLLENGANLSGGQRQRLEIARGLLKNPSILILDECTSAMDAEMEERVIRNIHRRGCAILMIAHRLSSIKYCDEICVMEKGRIVNTGTHEQLKAECSIYRDLVNAESQKFR